MKQAAFLIIIAGIFSLNAFSQNRFPEFKNQPVEIQIPTNMLGVRVDKAGSGTITYTVTGHLFTESENSTIQEKASGFSGKTSKATPYETLTELVDVVRRKDWGDLMDLYTSESRDDAERIVPKDKREQYFTSLNATKEVKAVLGMEYGNRYVVMIENTDKSVNPVFFEKKKNKYLLVAVADSSAMLWNIGVYLRFRPGPMVAANLVSKQDSVPLNEVQKLTFNVTAGNRVLLFKNEVNTTVIIGVQDNAGGDFNPASGIIEIQLDGKYLPARKQYEILALESNYPVIKVTEDMPPKATRISFKVY